MKVQLHARKAFEVRLGHRIVGTFFQVGREWNGMAELRDIETGALLVVHRPQGRYANFSALFDDIFDTGTSVTVASASPSVMDRLEEFTKHPDPGAVEFNSWQVSGAAR